MKSLSTLVLALGAGLAFAIPTAAHADLTFTLTTCNAGLGCGTGNNLGTVTLHQISATQVSVDAHLTGGSTWANTGLAGFEFNLDVSGATLSNVSDGNWLPTSGAPSNGGQSLGTDGMGAFNSQLDFKGATGTDSTDLKFTVTVASGLSLTDFTRGGTPGDYPTSPGFFFAADICVPGASGTCSSGGTGLVGATASAVPGPAVGAGLPGLVVACAGLLGLARRRRRALA